MNRVEKVRLPLWRYAAPYQYVLLAISAGLLAIGLWCIVESEWILAGAAVVLFLNLMYALFVGDLVEKETLDIFDWAMNGGSQSTMDDDGA